MQFVLEPRNGISSFDVPKNADAQEVWGFLLAAAEQPRYTAVVQTRWICPCKQVARIEYEYK